MHEVATRVFGERTTAFYELMKDPKTTASYMGTASLSSIVTDSAPASVAWATGSKTVNGSLSVLPDGTKLTTIMELAKAKGLANGLVTTTRVTHATPAAWVSHSPDRDAENDIALDYLSLQPDVVLGGGSRFFDPARRPDRRDLLAELAAAGYEVVRSRNALRSLSVSDKKIFGTFNSSHISYYVDRVNVPALGDQQPTLAEMTAVALNRLSRNPRGFVLQVEAGRIDHANHSNDAWGALMDTYEMDLTLRVIREYMAANPNTLLVVTSDHGNAGWGINGTGTQYNDATQALLKLARITRSFETLIPMLRGKSVAEIKTIVATYTGFNDLTDTEAQMIFDAMLPGHRAYPGDFPYSPDTELGRLLAHNDERVGIRRGNVGFTSNNHTGEDQILLLHGNTAHTMGIGAYCDNTDLFGVMCRFLNIKAKRNPRMSAERAARFVRRMNEAAWNRSVGLHVR
jgi:alkaline phosphatase